MKVLVTGANGFIARNLIPLLLDRDMDVIGSVRDEKKLAAGNKLSFVYAGEIDGNTDWSAALKAVDCIVHLAGIAHIVKGKVAGDLDAFRRVNVEGTLNLARQAAHAGVSKFIYLSSIGVLGARTDTYPFTNDSPVMPEGAYAISKSEAEQRLFQEFGNSRMPVVIIRPPLVYGPDAPGNFRRLLKLVNSGVPLPFGRLNNVRSMISVNNLCDFIAACIVSEKANDRFFVIGDGSDWPVNELVSLIRKALNLKERMVPVPSKVLNVLATATGQQESLERLATPLKVSAEGSWQILDWKPPYSPEQELVKTVKESKSAA